jgi:hypothetical protein
MRRGNGGGGGGASEHVFVGNPAGWQPGVWYQQEPGGYAQSLDQDPTHSADPGTFAQYNDGVWTIYGWSGPGTPADGGTAPPGTIYRYVVQPEDGPAYTELVVSSDAVPSNLPPNAFVNPNTDGTMLIIYNNDGSPWAPGGEGPPPPPPPDPGNIGDDGSGTGTGDAGSGTGDAGSGTGTGDAGGGTGAGGGGIGAGDHQDQ